MTGYGSCRADHEFGRQAEFGSDDEVIAGHCITCGDDGDPMAVIAIDEVRGLALCEGEDGKRMSVETALVAAVSEGEILLVHAGTAIAKLEGAPT